MNNTNDTAKEVYFRDRQPNYIEFIRMDNNYDMDRVAKRFLGEQATYQDLLSGFGIDLRNYTGFYGEVGTTDSPAGPLVPGRIKPILGVRMAESGNEFKPLLLKAKGFITGDKRAAWIKIEEWDKITGDDLGERIKKARDIATEFGPEVAEDLTVPVRRDDRY